MNTTEETYGEQQRRHAAMGFPIARGLGMWWVMCDACRVVMRRGEQALKNHNEDCPRRSDAEKKITRILQASYLP